MAYLANVLGYKVYNTPNIIRVITIIVVTSVVTT